MKNKTQTSAFGVSGRYGHDSSPFYNRKIYRDAKPTYTKQAEQPVPAQHLNKIFCQSSTNMSQLPDNSIHLMITSPPYNVGKDYDSDMSMEEYRAMLRQVWAETYRVLVDGGRACINVANIGRKPYIPLNALVAADMADIGYLMRGEIIWEKGASAGGSCAWGSWCSPSNPVLRDTHEYILIFSKNEYKRSQTNKDTDLTREEFLTYTKSVWEFHAESAKRVNHAAPFPEELPNRLIKLYSYQNDVILDPFMGSGTTAVSSVKNNRHFIGYDICSYYVRVSNDRLLGAKKIC